MPLLMEYNVDFYWNGHEHTMVYANYAYSQTKFDDVKVERAKTYKHTPILEEYQCEYNVELHFGLATNT